MDRRRFVRATLGAGALISVGACGRLDAGDLEATPGDAVDAGQTINTIPWGVQLYTIRSLMSEDVERTLGQVAEIGYSEVEFAGYFGRSPEQIRQTLDAEGLRAPATHVSIEQMRAEAGSWLETANTIGHGYLVVPSLPVSERPDADAYRRLADEFNGFGEQCREAGVRFAYHNHDFEIPPLDGEVPLDILISGTDPELVTFEIDIFWVTHGGGDPLDYFARHPDRFELCHVKDRSADGQMVDVGDGVIDFGALFRDDRTEGMIHYFVEHDTPPDALTTIRNSYAHVSGLDV